MKRPAIVPDHPLYFEANITYNERDGDLGYSGRRFFITLEVRRKYVDLLVVATCKRITIPKARYESCFKLPAKVIKARLLPQLRRNMDIYRGHFRDNGKAVKRAIRIINAVRREGAPA